MAEGIFIDILPRFDMAAASALISKLTGAFQKAGLDIGATYGAEATSALRLLQEEVVKTRNIATAAADDEAKARQAVNIAIKKNDEALLAVQATQAKVARDVELQELRVQTAKEKTAQVIKSIGEVENATAAQRAQLNRAQIAEMAAVNRQLELQAQAQKDYAASTLASQAAIRNAQRESATASTLAADANLAASRAAANQESAAANMAATTSNIGRTMNTVGQASAVALGVIGVESIKSAGQFEAAGTRIQVSTGETAQQIKALQDGLLQLGPQVGYTAKELQDAAYTVSKAGFQDVNDQLAILKSGAQLARVEGVGLKEAMSGLTTTLNDFHIPASKVADVASQFQSAFGKAKAPVDELMGSLHNFEPLMKVIAGDGKDPASYVSQVGVMLAQMTQTGASPDQSSQNISNTLLHLIKANGPQRDMMGSLGLNPDDLSKQLNNPDVGPLGVMKQMNDAIAKKLGPDGNVVLDAMYKSSQNTENMKIDYDQLSEKGKAWADAIEKGNLSVKEMKEVRLQKEIEPALADWDRLHGKVDGVNMVLKQNQSLVQTVAEIMKTLTGTDQGMKVMAANFGDPVTAKKTMDMWQEVRKVHADANGDIHDFASVEETFQFHMEQLKSTFNAAAIEIGQNFLPAAKDIIGVLKDVVGWFGQNKDAGTALVDTLALIAGTWAVVKTAMAIGTVVSAVVEGFTLIADVAMEKMAITAGAIISAEEQFGILNTSAAEANATMAQAGASAQEGNVGVQTATAEEIAAEERVTLAAGEANAAMGGGAAAGGAARTLGRSGLMTGVGVASGVGAAGMIAESQMQPYFDSHPQSQKNVLGDLSQENLDNTLNTIKGWAGIGHAKGGIVGFGSGGILPGYSPGVDNLLGLVNGNPVGLSGGEGIIVPEAVKALGPGFIYRINSMFASRSAGLGGFDAGGRVPWIPDPGNYGKPGVDPHTPLMTPYGPYLPFGIAPQESDQGLRNYGPFGPLPKGWTPDPRTTMPNLGGYPGANDPGSQAHYGKPGQHFSNGDYGWWSNWNDVFQDNDPAEFPGGRFTFAKGGIPGFAPGGVVGGGVYSAIDQIASSMVGTPYSQGNRTDCSGMSSRLINSILGIQGGDLMTTQTAQGWLANRGFQQGYGGPGSINVGWYNHGSGTNDGHMAITLPDGTHAESGGSHGVFLTGSGAAGAENPEFDQHMYLPVSNMFPEGSNGAGSGGNPFGGGGSSGGSGGSSGGSGGSSGSSGGSSGGTDWNTYNPLASGQGGFTLPNLAKLLVTFLAEMALGNPLGQLQTMNQQRQNGTGTGQTVMPDGSIAPNSPMYAPTVANSTGVLQGYNKEQVKTLDYQVQMAKAQQRVQDRQDGLDAAVAKHGANSSQAMNAQLSLDKANQSLGNLQNRLQDTATNSAAALTVDQQRLAEQQAKGVKSTTIDNTLKKINNDTINANAASAALPTIIPGSAGQGYLGIGGGPKLTFNPDVSGDATSAGPPSYSPDTIGKTHDSSYVDQPRPAPPRPFGDLFGPDSSRQISTDAISKLHDTPQLFQPGSLGGAPGAQAARRGQASPGSLSRGAVNGIHGVSGDGNHQGGPLSTNAIGRTHGEGMGVARGQRDAYNNYSLADGGGGYFGSPAGGPAGRNGPHGGAGDSIRGHRDTPGLPAAPPQPKLSGPSPTSAATAPGGGSHQPGTGTPGAPGVGVGGGAIGMAESAAALMAGPAAPAAQMGMQLANRFAGYMGQLGAIAASGVLETFSLNDSPLADPSKSLPGKLIFGLAGAHPSAPNSAGQTAPPLEPKDDPNRDQHLGTGQPPGPMVNIEHQEVHNGDNGQAARDTARQFMQFQGGGTR